jgi:signal transduction histidine kinase/ligand-binding sensor domain-containing protein/AraC-like DNA-binding protein/AmiR/NasT family two-component response regulator
VGYGLHAQTNRVTFDIIPGANGITLGKVNSVTQDKYGFMWFSDQTNQCIVRYDGSTMKRYAYDFAKQDTPYGMGGYYPEWLTTDRDGFIWIAYYGQGLDRFDPYNGTFVHYKNNPDDSTSLISNTATCVIIDRLGYVWIGTHSGLDRLDPNTGHFTHYVNESGNPNSLSYNVVRSVYEDRQGTIWVGTGFPFEPGSRGGLNRFDRMSVSFKRYLNDSTDPTSLAGNKVRALYEDSRGNFWVGSDGPEGLQIMDREKGTFTRYPYDPNDTTKLSRPPMRHVVDHITFITEDNEGQIWIGTLSAGAIRYDPVSKKIVHYGSERNVSGDFIDGTTWCIHVSRDGLVWISTQQSHLYKVDPRNLYIDYKQDGLLSFALENETTAWFGFDDRVIRQDLKKGNKQVFWHSPENRRSHIRRILRDHSGTIWLAANWGLSRYDHLTTDFTVYRKSVKRTDSRNWNSLIDICEDEGGNIWTAGGSGLAKFDRGSGSYIHIPLEISNSVSIDPALFAVESYAGEIWMGSAGEGVIRFNDMHRKFRRYLKGLTIMDLYQDSFGSLWAGTSVGLYRFDRDSEDFKSFSTDIRGVNCIIEDRQANLWLGGYQGFIYRVDKDKKKVTFLDHRNMGIPVSSGFYPGGAFLEPNGRIVLTSGTATITFDPEKVKYQSDTSRLYFTGFWIGERQVQALGLGRTQDSADVADEIRLSHKENTFSFTAADVDLRSAGSAMITYMLENYDVDWRSTQPEARIIYYKVPPGAYNLVIRNTNSSGQQSQRALHIVISPPWWATTTAYGVYVICFAGGIFGIHTIQKRRVIRAERERAKDRELAQAKKIEEAYQQLDNLKTRFFTNISHEFRTPITLIQGPLREMYDKALNGEERSTFGIMLRNAQRLSKLINQLLDLSKLEAGKMTLHACKVELVQFLREIAASYESLAANKNIKYSFYPEVAELTVYVDMEKMEKVVHNLLSNAFKFTKENGEVIMYLKAEERHCNITVKDTGIGIPPDQLDKIFDRFHQVDSSQTRSFEGSGLGMALAKELVELHHGKITVESIEGEGTTFTVALRLGKDHLNTHEIIQGEDRRKSHTSIEETFMSPDDVDVVKPTESIEQSILLIVEDNADMRHYIHKIFAANYQIIEAVNGKDGLTKALEVIPDLIISDVMMPEMDGYKFCEQVKSNEKTSHVPVILLTAKADTQSKLAGLETGADDYLSKPFDTDELKIIVRNRIEERRKMRERFSKEITLEPRHIAITSFDEKFLTKVLSIIEDHMDDEMFSVDELSRESGYSNAHFYRKIKALTGEKPNQFLRTIRLKRAAELLRKKSDNVTQIAYSVGFSNLSYFTKCFKEQFGVTPGQFADGEFTIKS